MSNARSPFKTISQTIAAIGLFTMAGSAVAARRRVPRRKNAGRRPSHRGLQAGRRNRYDARLDRPRERAGQTQRARVAVPQARDRTRRRCAVAQPRRSVRRSSMSRRARSSNMPAIVPSRSCTRPAISVPNGMGQRIGGRICRTRQWFCSWATFATIATTITCEFVECGAACSSTRRRPSPSYVVLACPIPIRTM